MEGEEQANREDTRRTQETQTVCSAGDQQDAEGHSCGNEPLGFTDNNTSLGRESGPQAMRLETPQESGYNTGSQSEVEVRLRPSANAPPRGRLQPEDQANTRNNTLDRPAFNPLTPAGILQSNESQSHISRLSPQALREPSSAVTLSSGYITAMTSPTSCSDSRSEQVTSLSSSQQASTIPKKVARETSAVIPGQQPALIGQMDIDMSARHEQPPEPNGAGREPSPYVSTTVTPSSEAGRTQPETNVPPTGIPVSEATRVSSSDVSSTLVQSSEAGGTPPGQSSGSRISTPNIQPPEPSRPEQEQSSSSDVSPMDVQLSEASGNRYGPPGGADVSQTHGSSSEESGNRYGPPRAPDVSQTHGSPEASGTAQEQPGTDSAQGQTSSTTSAEDTSSTKLDAVPADEPTQSQPEGCCSTCISTLIDHWGDTSDTVNIKENILHELRRERSPLPMKTICGLLQECLPCMEQWKKEALMSGNRKHHETEVHDVINELKNNGVTIGQAVQYFLQENSKRLDIVKLIYKIHQCEVCEALIAKISDSSN